LRPAGVVVNIEMASPANRQEEAAVGQKRPRAAPGMVNIASGPGGAVVCPASLATREGREMVGFGLGVFLQGFTPRVAYWLYSIGSLHGVFLFRGRLLPKSIPAPG
jgi:hypothetical protein